MELTYLAHACLCIEAGGTRLVTDPWLDGPTYLGAWWHFPEPVLGGADLRADYVYLTHEHVDHFHQPTLRALPRETPILIGRFMKPRFRDQLRALGFSDVRELPHGREVELGALRLTSYQYRADDTALVISDGAHTLLDLNDCLLRAGSLAQVLDRHGPPDLLAMSFANAEAYPIVYDFDDPSERADWDDQSRFDGFLEKVERIGARSFVPFASMFCFLSDDMFALNDRIVSPAELIARGAGRGLPMNPGDRWTPERGPLLVKPIDWSQKPRILQEYRQRHAAAVRAQADSEVVPGGREALRAAAEEFFRGFAGRLAWPLKQRLDLALRVDIEGPAGGVLWLRFSRGRLDLAPPPGDDQWDVRMTVRDWPFWRCVTRADTWQTFGVSCRFRMTLRRQMRQREVYFWFLLYLDDMGYVSPWRLLHPRALGVLGRRRRELMEHARSVLGGRFVDSSLRGKFDNT